RHQLEQSIRRHQQPDHGGRSSQMFGIERQQRQNNGEAENIDQNDQKNGEKGGLLHGRGGRNSGTPTCYRGPLPKSSSRTGPSAAMLDSTCASARRFKSRKRGLLTPSISCSSRLRASFRTSSSRSRGSSA